MLTSFFASGANSIERLFTPGRGTVDDVFARQDLISYLRAQRESGERAIALLEFVERYILRLIVAALEPQPLSDTTSVAPQKKGRKYRNFKIPPGLVSKNATEMIVFYLDVLQESTSTLERIVLATIAVLGYDGTLPPNVVQCLQRILLAAFNANSTATTEAIAATMCEKIIRGTLRNISTSFLLADTILTLLGSSTHAAGMGSPDINALRLSEAWVQWHFAEELVSQLGIALREKDHEPYFYFLKGLLKCGLGHGPGPLVDVLLSYDVISGFLKTLLEACEEAGQSSSTVPLAAEGVQVLHSMMALVRQSLIPMEENDMTYTADVLLVAPIKCLNMYAGRLCGLISLEASTPSPSRAPGVQVALCELFVEIIRVHQRDLDQMIADSLFLEKLLAICIKHSESNRLSVLLHQALLLLFLGSTNRAENVLLQQVLSAEIPPKRGFLSQCVDVCTDESLQHTPLSAFVIDAFQELVGNALFREPFGSLQHVTKPFMSNPALKKRVQQMNRPITGAGFSTVGTAGQGAVRHRPFINHTGRELSVNDSLSVSPIFFESQTTTELEAPAGESDRSAAYIMSTADWETTVPVDTPLPESAFSAAEALLCDGEDTVTVELEWTGDANHRETSPLMRGYPRFRDTQISLEGVGQRANSRQTRRAELRDIPRAPRHID